MRVEFVARHDLERMLLKEFNTPRGVARYSTPEVTALELVGYPNHAGGIANVATVLSDLVALAYRTGDISRSIAARYLETNPAELYYLDWDKNDDWAANSWVKDGTIEEYEAEGDWNATE